jgi:hypothetical protein
LGAVPGSAESRKLSVKFNALSPIILLGKEQTRKRQTETRSSYEILFDVNQTGVQLMQSALPLLFLLRRRGKPGDFFLWCDERRKKIRGEKIEKR